jgi:hypothetical protein
MMRELRRLGNQIEHRAALAEKAQAEVDALLAQRAELADEYNRRFGSEDA